MLLVVPGRSHLRVREELVRVAINYEVGVDEYELVVLLELPYAKLAVVPLVVGVLLGEGTSDSFDELGFPAGGAEAVDGLRRDVGVGEKDEVFG